MQQAMCLELWWNVLVLAQPNKMHMIHCEYYHKKKNRKGGINKSETQNS